LWAVEGLGWNFFTPTTAKKQFEMTTTNAQVQTFAHNGGGKRKHATTADADISTEPNAAGAGPGYHMLQGESGVIPVPPHGVVGKTS